MRLTGSRPDADDLGSAVAERFGAPADAPVRTHGDDLLPGRDLVAELRKQVEALEALEMGSLLAPPPIPLDLPAPNFGGPGFPPPLPPVVSEESFEESAPTNAAELGAEPQIAPSAAPSTSSAHAPAEPERAPSAPPAQLGPITVKKSSEKKSGRKLFGKKSAPAGAAAKPDAVDVAAVKASIDPNDSGGPKHVGRPLGELLLGRGLVSEDQLRDALTTQTGSGKRLGNILVELGLLGERALVEVLAEQLQLEIVELARMELDPEIVTLLPEEDARSLKAVPIARDGRRIDVAVADPLADFLRDKLIEKLKLPVRLRFATASDIEAVINKMFTSAADLGDALRMFEAKLTQRTAKKDAEQQTATVVDENAPIVKIVNLILEQAVKARASDVHIEPMEEMVRVRVRTDGALHEVMTLPGATGQSLLSRIKVMSDMNIVERRKPQDGQFAMHAGGRDLDVRVSTTPTVFGEKCVMRVLDKTKAVIDLPGLGMSPETYERFSDLIRSPYGMVICAGPTGSGKTTTLYATLTAINNDDINVVTVEDPVEYVFPKINQIQINEAGGLTFATGLRAILRQDPDAILVGEIRDVETARIAVQAALTGHFVMSSLHATDATSALHRFMDMGIEPFLIASSLLGVVGQRLIRKICPHCIVTYDPLPEERDFLDRVLPDFPKTEFKHGAGCNFCDQTGYFDRVGIYEVLAVTDELKQLIVADAPQSELRELAVEQGMRTLREQAMELVMQDKTTIAEVLRTVYVL